MKSIFYNGQDFISKKKLSIKESFDLDLGEPDQICVSSFLSSEGVLNICFRSGTPLFISKPVEDLKPASTFINLHNSFVQELGVVLEVLKPGLLENIQYFFMSKEYLVDEVEFISADYSKKCKDKNIDEIIDISQLTLFGQDSDGTKYLYDKEGCIYLYCLDPSISNNRIQLVSGQAPETFYKSLDIKSMHDVFQVIF